MLRRTLCFGKCAGAGSYRRKECKRILAEGTSGVLAVRRG